MFSKFRVPEKFFSLSVSTEMRVVYGMYVGKVHTYTYITTTLHV